MYTPPHSPFASSFGFKSPKYASIDSRRNETAAESFDQIPTPPLDEHLVDPISVQSIKEKRISRVPIPLIKARTFPTSTSHARGSSDVQAGLRLRQADISAPQTFHLSFPFIYSNSIPVYHLETSSTTGELRIRKLHPRDTRAHSVPDIHHDHHYALRLRDEDALFTISESQLHGKNIHGPVCLSTGSTLWHKPLCKIWQGGPGSKHLLYSVCTAKGTWEDSEGRECAREVEGRLEVNGDDGMDVSTLR